MPARIPRSKVTPAPIASSSSQGSNPMALSVWKYTHNRLVDALVAQETLVESSPTPISCLPITPKSWQSSQGPLRKTCPSGRTASMRAIRRCFGPGR